MRRSVVVTVLLVALGLFIAAGVYAWWPGWGHGMGHGMGHGTGTNIENIKKFQKETLPLRDELITKQLELQNEYGKPTLDINRITTLRKEIIDLQAKIQAVAEKYGIGGPMGGHRGSQMGGHMGGGMMGPGMCGCPMCGW
ncbi:MULTISPECIES: hypothetical protein [Thermodesulfovibrio]|jgi:zinc resistance-associated protein|uniref:hypothetical protein n=1 Tax=Thermodesulfovibrio TaxID=28261 RepID=UPI002618461E|nr:hypothetical protein [Thermodesulfovibrio sp.]